MIFVFMMSSCECYEPIKNVEIETGKSVNFDTTSSSTNLLSDPSSNLDITSSSVDSQIDSGLDSSSNFDSVEDSLQDLNSQAEINNSKQTTTSASNSNTNQKHKVKLLTEVIDYNDKGEIRNRYEYNYDSKGLMINRLAYFGNTDYFTKSNFYYNENDILIRCEFTNSRSSEVRLYQTYNNNTINFYNNRYNKGNYLAQHNIVSYNENGQIRSVTGYTDSNEVSVDNSKLFVLTYNYDANEKLKSLCADYSYCNYFISYSTYIYDGDTIVEQWSNDESLSNPGICYKKFKYKEFEVTNDYNMDKMYNMYILTEFM